MVFLHLFQKSIRRTLNKDIKCTLPKSGCHHPEQNKPVICAANVA
uniref:Uncharacterized protein n=1 Tax=Anguilla anguilla TaxID=7936 RepID=A0A0E9WIG7_ANGAN